MTVNLAYVVLVTEEEMSGGNVRIPLKLSHFPSSIVTLSTTTSNEEHGWTTPLDLTLAILLNK